MTNLLTKYLAELDKQAKTIDEQAISDNINKILKENTSALDLEDKAESIAFRLLLHPPLEKSDWGIAYGPRATLKNKAGQIIQIPAIDEINEQVISYWRKRSAESSHPVLVNRYSDLVFEFERKTLNTTMDHVLGEKVIDSAIDICDQGLNDSFGCISKLERALNLALKLNSSVKIEKLKQAVITTENKFAEDDKPGLWGHAFNFILYNSSKKVVATPQEKEEIINTLEERLARLSGIDDPNPWHIERAASLLGKYYSDIHDSDNLKRVLTQLELAFRRNKHSNADGFLINNYLEKLIETYLHFSSKGFKFAKDSQERILAELNNPGGKREFQTQQISVNFSISDEEVNELKRVIFGEKDEYLLEKVVANIGYIFLLDKARVEHELKKGRDSYIFLSLANHTVNSPEGYPIAKFGGINEAYEKHLLETFSQHLNINSFLLRIIFAELRSRFKPEALCRSLLLSPVLTGEDEFHILKMLNHFWQKDYLSANCLGIPLIESSIRELYAIHNQTYIKQNDEGGYDVMSLGKLLEKGLINKVFRTLNKDVEYYFKALLTERTGWNLRNNLAHGINISAFQSEDAANRTIHVLFCLSLVRPNKQ